MIIIQKKDAAEAFGQAFAGERWIADAEGVRKVKQLIASKRIHGPLSLSTPLSIVPHAVIIRNFFR